jgi:apolipoprotein N-acyltransferase
MPVRAGDAGRRRDRLILVTGRRCAAIPAAPAVLLLAFRLAVMIALPVAIVFDRFSRARRPPTRRCARRAAQYRAGRNVGRRYAESNFAKLEALSGKPGPRPRLLVWPEAAVPFFLEDGYPDRAGTAIAAPGRRYIARHHPKDR